MTGTPLGPSFQQGGGRTIRSLFVASLLLAIAGAGASQQTGTVSGRVIDRQSLEPVREVLIAVRGTTLTVITSTDGTFRMSGVPSGAQVLVFTHIAWGEQTQPVQVVAGEDTRIEVRISRQAIEISPLRVEAVSELEGRRESAGHRMNEIRREEIDEAARRGVNLPELLRQGMSGIRVWGGARGVFCVEYRGTATARVPCREVMVVLDGVRVSAPGTLFATMPLMDIERLELLSPGEAGARYGSDAGWGVLLIETRTGVRRAQPREVERLPVGFDAALEQRPYPWARVLGSSILANAIGVGLGLVLADQCLRISDTGFEGLRIRCPAGTAVAAGFGSLAVPAIAGSFAAQWAGSTDRSRGRVLPSAALAATTVTLGYLLVVQGHGGRSDVARTAGRIVLVLGAPVIVTLADRGLRALRSNDTRDEEGVH